MWGQNKVQEKLADIHTQSMVIRVRISLYLTANRGEMLSHTRDALMQVVGFFLLG